MIYKGNSKIKEVYRGSTKFKEVRKGSDLVWSGSKPSYLIKMDGTRIDFELENTPIATFWEGGNSFAQINVNGSTLMKRDVREIYFGDSYGLAAEIGGNFLNNFIFTVLVDLSGFISLTSIGGGFLYYCLEVTQIVMNTVGVPAVYSYQFLAGIPAAAKIYVPLGLVNAYKTTAPWSNHASKIQGY